MKTKLGDICHKETSGYAQKDLENLNGEYPIYGASGYIKCIDSYHQENPYVAVVKDGAGVGRTMYLPGKSSVIGTLQYLIPEENIDSHYLYYLVKAKHLEKYYMGAAIPHIYFKDYKNENIPDYDLKKQLKIVSRLSRIEKIIDYKKQQIEQLDNLIKARFVEMFGDPLKNSSKFSKKMLKETCKVVTGNTPSRAVPKYYGEYVEWIKTDNIVQGVLNPTHAVESLSKEGVEVGRVVESNTILMACIAGSISSIGKICITDRRVAFNQQINAVIPEQYNTLFLYVLFQISKSYLVSEINMALKGILSKSKLEEKEFIVPPIELQDQFAEFVKEIDKSKVTVQKSLNETQLLYNSLMQQYFG